MDHGFQEWVESVLPPLVPDEGGDVGHRTIGLMDFMREMFDKHGPVPLEAVRREGNDRKVSLTRTGADLFRADLERTTSLRPVIEVSSLRPVLDDWPRGEIGIPIASYNGNYSSPAVFSLRAPEAICEVADNLREHVMDDLGAVWPVCPEDGWGLDPHPVDGRAEWYCWPGGHAVAPIGQLPPTDRPARDRVVCLDCGSFNMQIDHPVNDDPETAARMLSRYAGDRHGLGVVCADCGSRHTGGNRHIGRPWRDRRLVQWGDKPHRLDLPEPNGGPGDLGPGWGHVGDALAALQADLSRTVKDDPQLTLYWYEREDGSRYAYLWKTSTLRGGIGFGLHRTYVEVVIEMAAALRDAVQDNLLGRLTDWPLCPIDGWTLNVVVEPDQTCIWVCNQGGHSLGEVGQLRAP